MESFPIPAPPFNGYSRAVAAGNAFEWVRQGWGIFMANPAQWLVITIILLVLVLGLNIVPLVGTLAANLLIPLLGAGMLQASRKANNGDALDVNDLFIGFKQNSTNLLMLGVLYMFGMLVIFMLVAVLGGGSMVGGMMMGQPAGLGLAFGGLIFAMLLSMALSVPVFMAIWFAPALVLFNNMPPLDALKASFNACLKNVFPFLIYGVIVLVLSFFAALPVGLGFLLLIPVLSGSVYASYRDIFVAD